DEPHLLTVTAEILRILGYDATPVPNGSAALALVMTAAPFDVLLTDVVMPGDINGFDLAAKVREMLPDIGVVYMSGHIGFAEDASPGVPGPIVQKPCDINSLSTALGGVVSDRAAARSA
ncbi:MAG TPA: response regulator, partial [Paracoccaceae bacterium]|nr:response regulator [Paracoccaceae bacterium]